MSVLELDAVTYTYPGAAAPALATSRSRSRTGELVLVAGHVGLGQVDAAARGQRAGAAFSRRRIRRDARRSPGWTPREHGPGELAAVVGTLFQDPETQVVMATVRAELAFGLENRGEAPAAVARAVEEAALALGIGHLLDRSDRRAVRRRAAAGRARRRARRAGRSWCCSTSRRRSSTRSPATS